MRLSLGRTHAYAAESDTRIATHIDRSVAQLQRLTPLRNETQVDGDVSIRFFWFSPDERAHSTVGRTGRLAPGGRSISYGSVTGKQLIFVQFHTAFATDTMVFPKKELDGAYNKGQASFAEDFALTVKLDACNNLPEPSWARAGSNGWEAESKHQHALYMSLSYHNRLATSHRYVANIMKRLCPECKVFRQGDAIYNPAQHKNCRSLYYVEKGNVIMMPKAGPMGVSPEYLAKGTTDIGQDLVWGSGEFLNLPNFIIGKDITTSQIAYAYSETVTMRVWMVPILQPPGRRHSLTKENRSKLLSPLRLPGEEFSALLRHE